MNPGECVLRTEWLGLIDYIDAVKKQERTVNRSALIRLMAGSESQASEVVLGLEHPLTITLGKRSNPLNDIKASMKELRAKGVAILGTERGGEATLHNPGQLVIYPIINLRDRGLRVRDYIHLLQDVTQRFLLDHGVRAVSRGCEPGLYTDEGKIVFFGIRIKNGMTSHGLAINVNNNLSDFTMIRSCGRATETFSQLSQFVAPPSLEELFHQWVNYFRTGLSLTQDLIRPMLENQFDSRI